MDDVKSKVLRVLEIDLEIMVTSLDQKLELDSLEEVELVMWLEEDLRITIFDQDIEGLDTPRKIIEYVEKIDKYASENT